MAETKKRFLCCLVSFVLGVGIGAGGYGIVQTIKGGSAVERAWELSAGKGGMQIPEETTGKGMKLTSARIEAADYEENGISPQAEAAYTLTATITPADAENKAVDWTIAFKNASSSWATGKTVTDYVTVTPSSDGALTAVVENKAEFGERIVVRVTSRDNKSAFAECTVDYAKGVTALSGGSVRTSNDNFKGISTEISSGLADVMYPGNMIDCASWGFAIGFDSELTPTYSSAYTLDDSFTLRYDVRFSDSLLAGLSSELGKTVTMIEGADYENAVSMYFLGGARSLLHFLKVDGISEWNWEMDPAYTRENLQAEGFAINDYMKKHYSGADSEIYLVMTATGSYSTYTKEIPLYFPPDAFVTYVTGVSLDQSNIIF